ncbi:MAG: PilC/PilY family type IV pilus protein [Burkholderiaceae bacterium]
MVSTLRCNTLSLMLTMTLGIWHSPLFAASTDLSDTPLPVTSSVAPNIMFMLDTSGSMSNIVPDTPYDSSVTYLTTCPSGNLFSGGAAAPNIPTNTSYDIAISGGAPTIGGKTFGTAAGQGCFDPALRYKARLLAPVSSYLDAAYEGNFLNWYFCTGAAGICNSAANFGAGATRKPGTSTRLEVTKVAAKAIVDSLDNVRAGLSRYNSISSGTGGELVVEVSGNTSAQKTALKNAIDAFSSSGNTPLAETLSGIGAYFAQVPSASTAVNLTLHPQNPSSGMAPSSLNKSTAAASTVFSGDGAILRNGVTGTPTIQAPIQYSCQKSFAVLMTDGRPQGDQSISSSLCDYLGITGSCPTSGTTAYGKKGVPNGTGADAGYHVNGTNKQFHIGGTHDYESAGSDYLDDVAAALYEVDLRPDLTKTAGTKNNLRTYTIGLADLDAINDPLLQEAATAGGGLFLTAGNSNELISAFQKTTDDILAKDGSTAAVSMANSHVTNTDNASYATSYNSGVWTGDLVAYQINTSTGVPNTSAPIWNTGCSNPTAYIDPTDTTKGVLGCSAQTLLDLKTPATRKIFTSNDSTTCFYNCGIPFQPITASGTSGTNKLSTAQQTLLNTPALTDGAAVVSYLRGDMSGETTGAYRIRTHLLGDAVNAEPLVIREPSRNYIDTGYSTYRSSNGTRTRLILQAANDGMVHAFNSLTGAEEWAYIPNLLISNAKDPLNTSTSLLNTRSRKAGFNHYFLLDGTPVAGDVDFNNAGTTGNATTSWGTIAVGGFGKGGRGYYALDLTTTMATDEAGAASKALWEFPRSISNSTQRASVFLNMGYGFGKPIITKTTAAGWVVLVTSGYNNGTNSGESGGDGLGHLYVLNAKTGDLIADLATTGCHATPGTNPCGLASINAYVENRDIDNTVEIAYGGDLYGNVYRFDLRGATVGGWSVSKLAKLRSGPLASDPVQSITMVPELAKLTISGADKYLVYVGTGMFLGKSDLPCPPSPATCSWTPNSQSTQTQTMYGLVDPRDGTTLPDPLLGSLVQQTYTTSGNTRTFSVNTVNYNTKKGWYANFTAGERIVTDPALASGALLFTSSIPSTTACIPGGSSWLYALDYQTGGQITNASFGGTYLGNALASRPSLIQLPNGKIKAVVRLSDRTTAIEDVPPTGTPAAGRRVSWRELVDK